jgi:hypothetical protein
MFHPCSGNIIMVLSPNISASITAIHHMHITTNWQTEIIVISLMEGKLDPNSGTELDCLIKNGC